MDVTHCNIGTLMSKFCMLPIVTSACQSVNDTAALIGTFVSYGVMYALISLSVRVGAYHVTNEYGTD